MSFRVVPKSVTSNDLERRNGRYTAVFRRIRDDADKMSREVVSRDKDSKCDFYRGNCWWLREGDNSMEQMPRQS